jgi:sigma-B regulation protein RsbU (phosphoserine phosphatase)
MSLHPSGYPDLDGIAFSGVSVPALEVGGDYFDFLPVTGERVGVVIGDVSGKGVPAALLMVMIRSVLRARVSETVNPSALVHELNAHLLTEGDDKMFVTLSPRSTPPPHPALLQRRPQRRSPRASGETEVLGGAAPQGC